MTTPSGAHPPAGARGEALVVIGNGMTGARLVEEIRRRRNDAPIIVYGDEPGGSYNRIMLSGVLGRYRASTDIVTHPAQWYADNGIVLRSGVRIERIERERRCVVDANGNRQPYAALVLATGSRPFVPPLPGIDHPRVRVFRTLADCAGLHAAAGSTRRAVVLGGGLLGLEAAAGLRALGIEVGVLHIRPTLMEQQLEPDGGLALQTRIEALGIGVQTAAHAAAIRALDETSLAGVELDDGTLVPADLVVVCCGIVPSVELARAAGLAVERGVVVDDRLRTSDRAIHAVGECVQHRGVTYGLVEPLWEQCRVLADCLVGVRSVYRGSQVGTRLKIAGINVVAVGERDPRPGDAVAVTIEPDGRYRRAIARDGYLVGAQVVGDAAAGAVFAQAFERRAPLAGSLGAFVFSLDFAAAGAAEPGGAPAGDDEQVCACNDVARGTIRNAVLAGARDVAAIGTATRAGTSCGTCSRRIAELIHEAEPTDRQVA